MPFPAKTPVQNHKLVTVYHVSLISLGLDWFFIFSFIIFTFYMFEGHKALLLWNVLPSVFVWLLGYLYWQKYCKGGTVFLLYPISGCMILIFPIIDCVLMRAGTLALFRELEGKFSTFYHCVWHLLREFWTFIIWHLRKIIKFLFYL